MQESATPQTNRTTRLLVVILIITLFGVGINYFITWATWDYDSNFLHASKCLSAGGVWDKTYQGGRCWYAGQCEDEEGFWYPAESRCVFESTTTADVL